MNMFSENWRLCREKQRKDVEKKRRDRSLSSLSPVQASGTFSSEP